MNEKRCSLRHYIVSDQKEWSTVEIKKVHVHNLRSVENVSETVGNRK